MRINFQCEMCGQQNCNCGVYLDIKNIGEYPQKVCHSYVERRLKVCGDCADAVHKALRKRIKIQQDE